MTTELQTLAQQARALAQGQPVPQDPTSAAEAEVARQLQICNACRYCEGFCAVFPAMTRRLSFAQADVHYLANLCHNCGACLHACQYAPPHDFAVNVPRAMAMVRGQTYAAYAWPAAAGRLYQRNGLFVALALALALAVFGWLVPTAPAGSTPTLNQLMSHNALVAWFAPVFLFAVLALTLGVRRFLGAITPATEGVSASAAARREAAHDAATLRYLDGGHGDGCHNEDDAYTLARRRAHHLTFYGFLLCFAATSVATLFHYLLGWQAPYDLPSLPKLLGAVGGVALLAGSLGLLRLNLKRHPDHGDAAQKPMDLGFIALLALVSASGLALWLVRATGAGATLPAVLALHLGALMALFITLPYGKFAHGIFRSAALLRWAVEKRQPNRLGLGGE